MKLYDYLCRRCGQPEERWVKKYDEPQECKCGGEMVKLPPATPTTFRFCDRRK